MNLLILTSSFPLHPHGGQGAAGVFVESLASVLAAQGHRVDVAAPNMRGDKGEWREISVHWLSWPGGDRRLSEVKLFDPRAWPGIATLVFRTPRRLASICRERHIEGIIAMWAVPAGWWARSLKKTLRLPFVTWCLGSDIWTFGRIPLLRLAVRAALRASDEIFADGIDLARETELLCRRRCAFLPSSRVLDKSLETAVELGGRHPLFFFVGRYAPVKGIDVLLEAMALYVARGGRGELVVRGGGPLEDAIRTRASRPDLRDRVRVGGYADEAVVVSYLKACDAQIIPSRRESIPVAFSDGLQMGRPLIVTDVGDMGAVMRKHPAGLVVPPENPVALAEAMLSIDRDGTDGYRDAVAAAAAEFDLSRSASALVTSLGQRR